MLNNKELLVTRQNCKGCVMTKYKCFVKESMPELIYQCPCSECIVKITCKTGQICQEYNDFFDRIHNDPHYSQRLEEYETKHNTDIIPEV